MQIVIDIPDEQIKKSLKESEYVLEDEGIKGFVNIAMLYTNGRLEFVDIERREDFYSCNFTLLPKGHGRLIDEDTIAGDGSWDWSDRLDATPTIIEAESEG